MRECAFNVMMVPVVILYAEKEEYAESRISTIDALTQGAYSFDMYRDVDWSTLKLLISSFLSG